MENLYKIIDDSIDEINHHSNQIEREVEKIEKVKYRINEVMLLPNKDKIKEELDSMTTDEVAEIFYHIKNSHHGQHIEKFSYLDR